MVFIICLFGTTIIVGLLCIVVSLKFLFPKYFENWNWFYKQPMPVVEKTYRMVEFQHSFQYSDREIMERMSHRYMMAGNPSMLPPPYADSLKHLEAIMEKQALVITRQMIKQGLIEIIQYSREDEPQLYYKTVVFKVRVYKEDGYVPNIKY